MREVNAARAARIVDRNERTIRRHIHDGSLQARKTHKGWRIRLDTLHERYGTRRPERPGRPGASSLVQHTPPVLVQHLVQQSPGPAITQDFRNHAEAARWLVLHGIRSAGTPKSWDGWMATPLTRADILGLAIRLCDTTNHRIDWRLVVCGDNECVCAAMLA